MSEHDPPSGFNPYHPSEQETTKSAPSVLEMPPGMQRGFVSQVPILGVLMIVQGVMNVLAGATVGLYSIFMPTFIEEFQREAAAKGQANEMPPDFAMILTIGGSAIAVLIGLLGILVVWSGIRVIQYRSHTLAIVMLCASMLTLFTCYCFPTSFALAIYGMIVLLNSPVRFAFDLRSQGHQVVDIQRAFLSIH